MLEKRIEWARNELNKPQPQGRADLVNVLHLLLHEVKWLKDEVIRLKEINYKNKIF